MQDDELRPHRKAGLLYQADGRYDMGTEGIRPRNLLLRCMAARRGSYWVAFCLDFDLAVQGDSLEEVRRRLEAQISEYVYDALVGEDRAHAQALLTRKAPLRLWLQYYWAILLNRLHHAGRTCACAFTDTIPLTPTHA